MKKKGFTLIELLIVVAIIGILAAIAVPNFLNAQNRAKVARLVSDLKAVSTAEEQYSLDRGQYTFDYDCNVGGLEFGSYRPLTTPTPYISSVPFEIFYNELKAFNNNTRAGLKRPVYEYTSKVSFGPNGSPSCKNDTTRYNFLQQNRVEYVMISLGPDGDQDDFAWDVPAFTNLLSHKGSEIYAPSNGLLSSGNVYVLNNQIIGGGY